MTSSTSNSRRALAWAASLVVAANAWVGWRLDSLVAETSVADIALLDARVRAFRAPERVRLLVFGNSHAMFALRPPVLAPTLGLSPDQAFSLALGGGTALEARLLARRHRAAFPQARAALVMVDESFLGRSRNQAARIRWLSRLDPAARWRFTRYFGLLDQRVALLAGLALPIADFNAQLRAAWRQDPRRVGARLAGADVPAALSSTQARFAAMPYRWGYPIGEVEVPEAVRRKYARAKTPVAMRGLARYFLEDVDALPQAFEDLEAMCRELESAGLRVQLVSGSLPAEFRAALTEVHGPALAAYRRGLDDYQTNQRVLLPLPDLVFNETLDGNHASEAGALTLTTALARHSPALRALLRAP